MFGQQWLFHIYYYSFACWLFYFFKHWVWISIPLQQMNDTFCSILVVILDMVIAAVHGGGGHWKFHRLCLRSAPPPCCFFSPFSFSLTHVPLSPVSLSLSLSLRPTSLQRSLEAIRDTIKLFVTGYLRCVQLWLAGNCSASFTFKIENGPDTVLSALYQSAGLPSWN